MSLSKKGEGRDLSFDQDKPSSDTTSSSSSSKRGRNPPSSTSPDADDEPFVLSSGGAVAATSSSKLTKIDGRKLPLQLPRFLTNHETGDVVEVTLPRDERVLRPTQKVGRKGGYPFKSLQIKKMDTSSERMPFDLLMAWHQWYKFVQPKNKVNNQLQLSRTPRATPPTRTMPVRASTSMSASTSARPVPTPSPWPKPLKSAKSMKPVDKRGGTSLKGKKKEVEVITLANSTKSQNLVTQPQISEEEEESRETLTSPNPSTVNPEPIGIVEMMRTQFPMLSQLHEEITRALYPPITTQTAVQDPHQARDQVASSSMSTSAIAPQDDVIDAHVLPTPLGMPKKKKVTKISGPNFTISFVVGGKTMSLTGKRINNLDVGIVQKILRLLENEHQLSRNKRNKKSIVNQITQTENAEFGQQDEEVEPFQNQTVSKVATTITQQLEIGGREPQKKVITFATLSQYKNKRNSNLIEQQNEDETFQAAKNSTSAASQDNTEKVQETELTVGPQRPILKLRQRGRKDKSTIKPKLVSKAEKLTKQAKMRSRKRSIDDVSDPSGSKTISAFQAKRLPINVAKKCAKTNVLRLLQPSKNLQSIIMNYEGMEDESN